MHSEYVAPGVSSTYSFTLGKALRAEVLAQSVITSGVHVVGIPVSGSGFMNFTYLLFDEKTRDGALVDPAWEPDVIAGLVALHQVQVSAVLLTHSHRDHTDLARWASDLYGAQIRINEMESWALGDVSTVPFAATGGKVYPKRRPLWPSRLRVTRAAAPRTSWAMRPSLATSSTSRGAESALSPAATPNRCGPASWPRASGHPEHVSTRAISSLPRPGCRYARYATETSTPTSPIKTTS